MDLLPGRPSDVTDVLVLALNWAIFLAVAVASYRRSRCLSRYPVWRSVAIAVVSGMAWLIWLLASVINRDQLAREWRAHRGRRGGSEILAGTQ
jgi:hypothetical protein